MKTGLESLDVGAPKITYSGNQGPKSPQEDQQKMAEFQLQEYMEEFERVFPDMRNKRGTPDYMKELQDYFEGLASKQSEGMSPMMAADGGIMNSKKKPVKQAGATNFLGKQEMVKAPKFWLSEPGHVKAKLAYITDEEEKILIDKNLYGSLKGKPNIGPAGLPSLQGGDFGSEDKGSDNTGGSGDGGSKSFGHSRFDVGSGYYGEPTDKKTGKDGGDGNIIEKAFDSYKKFSPIGIITRGITTAFGTPKSPIEKFEDKYGYTSDYQGTTGPSSVDDDDDDRGNGDGDYIPTPTVNLASIAEPITTDLEDENKFELRPDDFVSRYSIPDQFRLADGGRIGYAGGGITDLRQGYFLGKLVKKATRAVKKIAKSPLGKAALLYAGGTYLGGLKSLSGAKSSMGFLESLRTPSNLRNLVNIRNLIPGLGGGGGSELSKESIEDFAEKMGISKEKAFDFLSTKQSKKPGLGTLAAIALPAIAGGLYTKKTEEDQPTLDEAMAQTSRGSSPFDQYGGVSGFRDMIGRGNLDRSLFPFLQPTSYAADGGRIGLKEGGIGNLRGALSKEMFNLGEDDDEDEIKKLALGGSAGMPPVTMQTEGMDLMSFPDDESTGMAQATPTTTLPNQMPIRQPMMNPMMQQRMMQQRMNPMMGGRMMAQEGGMMDMGGMEKDYRNEGGFVPIGGQERADDVPARLSKNEFVFTADAVRNAGGGDIDKGAKIMENMMENLEAGGKVSKGSQGLKGAREMFATQKRLGEVL